MKNRLLVLPRAELDLQEHGEFLAADSTEVARRFFDRTRETFEMLRKHPEAGAPRAFHAPSLKNVRVWRIKDFESWLVFYRVEGDEVHVIRVLHGARDIGTLFE